MIRILLVEDNAGDARLVEECLREVEPDAVEVVWVSSLESAEERFREEEAEAVLLDLNLPDARDLETVARAVGAWPDTPIVVLTGQGSSGLGLRALQAGADDYLEKEELAPSLLWKTLRYSIERKRAERLRREGERFHRRMLEAIPVPLLVSHGGHILYGNPAVAELLGVSAAEELVGMSLEGFVPPEERSLLAERLRRLEVEGEALELRTARVRRRDGGMRCVEVRTIPVQYRGERAGLSLIQDVTERDRLERELERVALYDALTGLPNRTLFQDRLAHALERAARDATDVAILFLDLDRFKVVNDSLGHAAGDGLLSTVTDRLRNALRERDTVARFGGDEFAVLVEPVEDLEDVRTVARRVVAAFEAPFRVAGTRVRVDASVGIASSAAWERTSVADLLRFSEIAMYRAKEREGTHFHIFDPGRDTPETERLFRENELWRALEEREFVLHYQPTVRLDSGAVVGTEALVRWAHPERGLVPPSEFIPLAEETGLIVPIGEWVLGRACRDVAGWKSEGTVEASFLLSVNVSARQHREADFGDRMLTVLEEGGLAPGDVQLEITESVLVTGSEKFAMLRERGVRLAIDDFGTGYSSLTYLKSLEADILKIDRSFVADLVRDPRDSVIVRAIILVAREIGLEVIAEGIETAAQRRHLQELGCQLGQGFHFAHPVPEGEFRKRLAGRRAAG